MHMLAVSVPVKKCWGGPYRSLGFPAWPVPHLCEAALAEMRIFTLVLLLYCIIFLQKCVFSIIVILIL